MNKLLETKLRKLIRNEIKQNLKTEATLKLPDVIYKELAQFAISDIDKMSNLSKDVKNLMHKVLTNRKEIEETYKSKDLGIFSAFVLEFRIKAKVLEFNEENPAIRILIEGDWNHISRNWNNETYGSNGYTISRLYIKSHTGKGIKAF